MRISILLFLIFLSIKTRSQSSFENYYKSSADSSSFTIEKIHYTTDGGLIATGIFIDSLIVEGSAYLLKLNSSGIMEWIKGFNETLGWSNGGKDVIQTIDRGYLLIASSYLSGLSDILLIRTDSTGDTLWTKKIGGLYDDIPTQIIQTNDHGIAIAASTRSFGSGNLDMMLFKIDSIGNTQWCKYFGTIDTLSGNTNDDISVSLIQTIAGDYLLAGYIYPFEKPLLIETDTAGNLIWTKSFGIPDALQSITPVSNGYIITLGGFIIKLDFNGNMLWNRHYYLWPLSVCEMSNGDLLWVDGNGVVKSDSIGVVQFSKKHFLLDNLWPYFSLLKLLPNNQFAFGGSFGTSLTSNSGIISIFKSDSTFSTGCLVDDTTLSYPQVFIPETIPSLMINNTFVQTLNTQVDILYPQIQTFDCNWLHIETNFSHQDQFAIFPDPASNQFIVSSSQFQNGILEIYSLLGEKIYSAPFYEWLTVNCESIPGGIYFVRLSNSESVATKKLLIE